MEAEPAHPGALAQPTPRDLDAVIGEGITLALHPAVARALGLVGEHCFGVMPAQRPEDFTDRRCDRDRHGPVTLARPADLFGSESDLGPAQQTFAQPQSRGVGESEEWRIVLAHRLGKPLGFVIAQFADPLLRLFQPVFAPFWLAIKVNCPAPTVLSSSKKILGHR